MSPNFTPFRSISYIRDINNIPLYVRPQFFFQILNLQIPRKFVWTVWLWKRITHVEEAAFRELYFWKKSQVHQVTPNWFWILQGQSCPMYVPLVRHVPNFTPFRPTISHFQDICNLVFIFHMIQWFFSFFFKFQNSKRQLLYGLCYGRIIYINRLPLLNFGVILVLC